MDLLVDREIHRNDGTGGFELTGHLTPYENPATYYGDVHLADIDGDGDLDAIFASDYSSATGGTTPLSYLSGFPIVFRNDGTGAFTADTSVLSEALTTAQGTYGPHEYGDAIKLADIDGDGDVDIVLCTGSWPFYKAHLLLNSACTMTHLLIS